jgi:hypothetical protein
MYIRASRPDNGNMLGKLDAFSVMVKCTIAITSSLGIGRWRRESRCVRHEGGRADALGDHPSLAMEFVSAMSWRLRGKSN